MKVEQNKVVTLTYILRINGFDGEEIERATDQEPLTFVFGAGMMLPAFEQNIAGLSEGDTFKFKIKADDAYGQPSEDNIIDLPIEAFMSDGRTIDPAVKVGNYLTLQDSAGNQYYGKVTKIGLDTVTMDFNHPMAGQDLYFTGKILEVRVSNPEDLLFANFQ